MRSLTILGVLAACADPTSPSGATPSELEQVSAFWVPINSERLAVSGFHAESATCVSLIWDFSNLGKSRTAHCDDFTTDFPYAVVRPAVESTCEIWDYAGNAMVSAATGCIEPNFEGASSSTIDVTVELASDRFAGAVRIVTP